jgi:hypothetical protein
MLIASLKKLIAKKSKKLQDNYTELSSNKYKVLIPVSKSFEEIEKPTLTTVPSKMTFHF